MTDTKSAQDRAEEARMEVAHLTEVCWGHDTCQHCLKIRKAIDRALLLARLAQAEAMFTLATMPLRVFPDDPLPYKGVNTEIEEKLSVECQRLRREAEEVERGA